jgi:subtilisin family serine protease
VDLNHIYTAGSELATLEQGRTPRSVMPMPLEHGNARIGMIDSRVDTSHPVLAGSRIQSRDFVSAGAEMPDFHGTAIASIIAGNAADYQGLAPDAEVFAAGVFELDDEQGEIASTVSLLRALDWLISSEVDVVNISLAGPPNRLLEAALSRAAEREVVVLAAAGNGGPVARPMYPAAYDSVVAVTAVDASNRVFRLANRGNYLDLAAPGVGLLHARAGGGFAASSGTSFAVPFAATAAARLISERGRSDVMSLLYAAAEDLGPPGRDDIYGYGLLRLQGG